MPSPALPLIGPLLPKAPLVDWARAGSDVPAIITAKAMTAKPQVLILKGIRFSSPAGPTRFPFIISTPFHATSTLYETPLGPIRFRE